MKRLLTVSGSLRTGSSNSILLAAAARLAPPHVRVSAYADLEAIPAFNPDVEESPAPMSDAVARWRHALAEADFVLFSSPEYAHGIPGAFKNALDWVVGSGELVGKPVGLLSASAASRFAHPQIAEVLVTMSALLVPAATIVIDLARRGLDAEQLADDPSVGPTLRHAVAALVADRSAAT